jgi:hypothetical protein
MKTPQNLTKSADARLKKAIRSSGDLHRLLFQIQQGAVELRTGMPVVREMTASITQCVHEYSAYRNALETE